MTNHNEQDVERVAKAHPNYSVGTGGRRCEGCNEEIASFEGSVSDGWNQHLIRAALDAMGQGAKPCCEATEAIDGHWLVERHNHCTHGCLPEYGHEPGCGLVPLVDLRALDGWNAMGLPSREQVYSVLESAQENGWTWGKTTDAILSLMPAAYKPEVAELTSTYTPRTVTSVELEEHIACIERDYGYHSNFPWPSVNLLIQAARTNTPATTPTVTQEQVQRILECGPESRPAWEWEPLAEHIADHLRAAGIEVAK